MKFFFQVSLFFGFLFGRWWKKKSNCVVPSQKEALRRFSTFTPPVLHHREAAEGLPQLLRNRLVELRLLLQV